MNKKIKKITIPRDWSDVSLGDYEQWSLQSTDKYTDLVDCVCKICKIERAEIESYPVEAFNDIVKAIDFAFSPNFAPANSLVWENEVYQINPYEKMTLGEYVDIDAALKGDNKTYISDTLAIILRPINEKYDTDNTESRANLFRSIPCNAIMPVVAFFLSNITNLNNALALCSVTMEQTNHYLKDIKDSVPNGGGIRPSAIYQRIKLMRSIRHLEKALKTCSAFYSISKTKIGQTMNNETLKNN